jgi:hypothetical protein
LPAGAAVAAEQHVLLRLRFGVHRDRQPRVSAVLLVLIGELPAVDGGRRLREHDPDDKRRHGLHAGQPG